MTEAQASLEAFMVLCRDRVERALDRWMPPATTAPTALHEAMRYAAISGGKYLRPILVYAAGRTFGVELTALDAPACAVELIHAYSLVHDDLPAMDDDDLRRGKPTCHNAFGEATAILAGDALQALAFHILAADTTAQPDPARRLRMIDSLAIAISSLGMAGGQAIDLAAVGCELPLEELENMHMRKTGALIQASTLIGALGNPTVDEQTVQTLGQYAHHLGLAFQIRDDILDVESDTATLGKRQGADQRKNKPTYPALLGIEGAKAKAEEAYQKALAALDTLAVDNGLLREIAAFVVHRDR